MILQALKEYYDRKAADPESGIAPVGLEWKPLEFLIVINETGGFVRIEDMREQIGKKNVGKRFLLPRSIPRAGSKSYETTFLLWDHIGYLLGYPMDDPKSPNQLNTWIQSLNKLPDELKAEKAVQAILNFYAMDQLALVNEDPNINACLKSIPCNMSFRLESELEPVAAMQSVLNYAMKKMQDQGEDGEAIKGYCLVSGECDIIKKIHAKTPINKDNNSLISFQVNSGYDSYGKIKAFNAPVGVISEFSYTTALNTLLKSDVQRFSIADTIYVCWSQRNNAFDADFSFLFDSYKGSDDPDQYTRCVKALYDSIHTGAIYKDDVDQDFYVLALSPGGGSRIAIRDWQKGKISEFSNRVYQHFDDLKIIKPSYEREHYSPGWILKNIAIQDETKNIPPNIAGEFMRSILNGTPYPQTLLQAAVRRIKSDTENRVKPVRAALVKAYLNRYLQVHPDNSQKELNMALDKEQPSIGYQLGRLFAVYEKVQEEANGKATIQQSYYSSASSSPIVAFGTLARLNKHHISKLERDKPRLAVVRKKMIGEIMDHVMAFPGHLDLKEQGKFAIGYYHQMQDFYATNEEKSN